MNTGTKSECVSEDHYELKLVPSGGIKELKEHPMFDGIIWETLPGTTPPTITPFLPQTSIDNTDTQVYNKYPDRNELGNKASLPGCKTIVNYVLLTELV